MPGEMLMKLNRIISLSVMACASAVSASCMSMAPVAPVTLAGQPCVRPPVMHCPDTGCGAMVTEQGPVAGPAEGRRYFIDYPCDLKPDEKVTVVMSLHGFGSYGNWQRNYFPIMDYVDKYRLVVITPNSTTQSWSAADDEYLQKVVDTTLDQVGRKNVKAFWLAGHSQGGMTSRRIVCSPYFAGKVDGFLSLSGGRVGGQPARSPDGFGPSPQVGAAAAPPRPPAAAMTPPPEPTCDFSHIYATGEHEIAALPDMSSWAAKYGCDKRVREQDIVDAKAGYVYDTSRQNPANKGWGRPAAPGKAEEFDFVGCKDGRVVADVMRMDKGHTEGLEPHVTERLVKLMLSAKGGKIAASAS
jgi:pimeloyl-ACP methyl ester carboxylesterase